MTTIKNGLMSLFSLISFIVYLNLLWILFTLIGLVLFGMAPATCALIKACQRYVDQRDPATFNEFARDYRRYFKASVTLQLCFCLLGSLLLLNYRICLIFAPNWLAIRAIYLAMALVFVLVHLLSLLNLVEFPHAPLRSLIKLALFLLFRFPGKSLAFVFSFGGCFLLLSLKSVLPVLLGASMPLFLGYLIYQGTVATAQQKSPPLANEG